MRILITEIGSELMRSFEYTDKQLKDEQKQNNLMTRSMNNNNKKTKNILKKSSSPVTKTLNVHQMKLNLPKNISEKYNEVEKINHSSNSSIVHDNSHIENTNLNTNTHLMHSLSRSIELPVIKQEYSIGEIIRKNVFREMKNKMKSEYQFSKQKTNQNGNMRSPIRSFKDVINKVNYKASTKINSDQVNLIYYLNSRNKISGNLINKLATCSENRMTKLNKICQKVAQGDEKDEVLNKVIQSKILAQKIKQRDDYREDLIKMEKDIKREEEIIRQNIRKPEDKERYYYQHKEFQKKWEKYKIDLLYNRKPASKHLNYNDILAIPKKVSENSSFSDETND